jgi:hypothetical protein
MKRKQKRPIKSRPEKSKARKSLRANRRTHRVRVPAATGMRSLTVRTKKDASLAGKYWNAVHKYVAQGDASELKGFEGARITSAQGRHLLLLTDLKTLNRLAGAGVLSFESIYARRI